MELLKRDRAPFFDFLAHAVPREMGCVDLVQPYRALRFGLRVGGRSLCVAPSATF